MRESELLQAVKLLLEDYDEESGAIDVRPEPSCQDCMAGSTPDKFNRGPCPYHRTLAAIRQAEKEKRNEDN